MYFPAALIRYTKEHRNRQNAYVLQVNLRVWYNK